MANKVEFDDLFGSDVLKKLNELEQGLKGVLEAQKEVIKQGSKDMGSAAVLLSLLLAGVIWGVAILSSLCSV